MLGQASFGVFDLDREIAYRISPPSLTAAANDRCIVSPARFFGGEAGGGGARQ